MRRYYQGDFVFKSKARIDYLEDCLQTDLSATLKEMETWVSPSTKVYFVGGKPVLKLTGPGKKGREFSYKLISSGSVRTSDRSLAEMISVIREANSEYLRYIKYEAECFIKEMAKEYKSRTVFVSFSGGKDSSVVSHLVMNAFGRSDVLHVFADTTIEAPDTYTYIEDFKKVHSLTPVVSCKSSLDFFEVAKDIGTPSRILRWCCTTHKTNPLGKIVAVLNPSAGVLAFDGVRKCESNRRANYLRVSSNHKIGKEVLASPILEWSDIQLWIYILVHGLTLNIAYNKGFRRVGCLYCPFNSTWSELLIRYYYPEEYSLWNSLLYEHAERIKHVDPEIYVNHGWRVRAGGRGLDSYKTVLDSYPCAISEDALNYQLVAGSVQDIEVFLRPFGNQVIIHQDSHSKSFMINDMSTGNILASVELSYEENTARITYLAKKGKLLLRKRIEKQLRKLQSCIKCGACTSKCPAEINPFEGVSGIDYRLCVNCLKCVSFDCPVVDSLKRRGRG
jgi:phosphoadenosine phosphosulfate reductase